MSSGNEHLPLMAVGLVVNVESQIKHKVNVDKVIFFHNFHTATEKKKKKGLKFPGNFHGYSSLIVQFAIKSTEQ